MYDSEGLLSPFDTSPGVSRTLDPPNAGAEHSGLDALISFLDQEDLHEADIDNVSHASAASPTPQRGTRTIDEADLTATGPLGDATMTISEGHVRATLQKAQAEIKSLKADNERLRAIARAAADREGGPRLEAGSVSSSAAREILQHFLAITRDYEPATVESLAMALVFTRQIDALVYPHYGISNRADEAIFTFENLKTIHARVVAWERLAREA